MPLYLDTESWISVQWMISSEATTFPRFNLIPPLHRSTVTLLNLPGALITQSSQPVTSRPCDAEPSGTSIVSPFFISTTRRCRVRPAMTRRIEGMPDVVVRGRLVCRAAQTNAVLLNNRTHTKGVIRGGERDVQLLYLPSHSLVSGCSSCFAFTHDPKQGYSKDIYTTKH